MSRISNTESLVARGMSDLRRVALGIIEAGLEAVEPVRAVERTLSLRGSRLTVAGREYDLSEVRDVLVLGAGKASLGIAEGIERVLGDRIAGGLVVVRRGSARPLSRVRVFEADHPIPSEASLEGARGLLALAKQAGQNDLVLACFTGGSSALASYPAEGTSLEEKRHLNRLLLGSGANIGEINSVRKHLSRIKGGRLGLCAAPARVVNLTVSDVVGDREDLITDPTVRDTSTVAEAVRTLRDYGLWDEVAPSIREHLTKSSEAESPDLSALDVHTVTMVTGGTACRAMAEDAKRRGFEPAVLTTSLEGEGQEAGKVLASVARECSRVGRPFGAPSVLLGCGGETTVALAKDGKFHSGGPNQEVALSFALGLLPSDRVAAAFLDTDGADGGTDFAGALVDGTTASGASELGLDIHAALRAHEASGALELLGGLVFTGPTHTNVNDLFTVVIG